MNGKELVDQANGIADSGVMKLLGRIFMTISIPLIGWFGVVIWNMNVTQIQMLSELKFLTKSIEEAEEDRYKGSDALKDFRLRDQRSDALEERIERNKHRLDELEERARL